MPIKQLILIGILSAATFGLAAGGGSPEVPNTSRFAVAGPLAAVISDPVPIDDPFPIQRIRATESDIPSILKQAEVGPLVLLKRNEFESRVRAAGRQLAEARTAPRITHTRYAATLVNGDLVGTAELDLTNASSIPQYLILEPLRLALTATTWSDGREAIVGVPQGSSSSAVWVDRPGLQTLKFGWSAAGIIEFGERRFELRVPSALSTELELELPTGQRPNVTTDVLLTGPFPSPKDKALAKWIFRFGGRQRQLDFTIRSTVYSGVAATANLAARYDLTTDLLTGTFEYDLRPAKGTVGEWIFTVDPGLRVTDVVVNNRAGWTVEQSDASGGQRQLRVALNQPGIGGKVMISCVAPFPDPLRSAGSPLPAIRPVGALLDDETMEIHLSPELKLERWMPGDYRLVDAQILPDQSQMLFLSGTLLQPGGDRVFRQPPAIITAPTEPEFETREQIAWRFDNDRAIAQVQIGIRVRRSPLFRLILRPPSDYSFVRATSAQDDLIAATSFSSGGAIVEFIRPLANEQTADLTFEFRGPQVGPKQFIFPTFSPVGAVERIGVLGIVPGPHWEMETRPGAGVIPTNSLDSTAVRQPAGSVVAFRYRGSNPAGSVTLSPVRRNSATEASHPIESKADKFAEKTAASQNRAVPEKTGPQSEIQSADRAWQFKNLYLVTSVRNRGDVEMIFGGTAVSPPENPFPIRMPPGAKIRATYVGERLLEPGVQQLSPEGILRVPIPTNGPVQFEVWYNLPVESGFATRIRTPEPGLPGESSAIQHWWTFGAGLLPSWPLQAWDRCKTTDLPVLLGSSDSVGAGALISRIPVDEVRVISTKTASAIGISSATGLFLLGWIGMRRRTRHCPLLVLGGLFIIGAVNLLGPPWWQRATVVPLTIGLPTLAGLVIVRSQRVAGGAVLVAILCAMPFGVSTAQPTTPAIVVLLPPDADGQEKVIASKNVIDRLAAIARNVPSGAIIAAADYEVTVEDNMARVIARMTAYAPADNSLTASVPLSDARLETITVDGKPAYPSVQKPGWYTLALSSTGRHAIEVHFTLPLSTSGTERELHFGVPECPMTRATAYFPTTARQIQLPGRIGKQSLVEGKSRRLEVNTGSTKAVQFRWRDGIAGPASLKIREACIWDVSEKGAELTACYHIRADQGPITNLKFDLPVELEPVDVSLRPDPTGGLGLRDWSLLPEQGGFRQLRLDLQGPSTGRMLVAISCRLRKAVTLQPLLRFPKPLAQGVNMEADIVYGLRIKEAANKFSIDDLVLTGTIDYDPGALIRDKEWIQVPALRLDANSSIRVFRPNSPTPELRPTLRPLLELPAVNLDTSWQVGPLRADANGTIHWSRKEAVALVEFSMPGIRLLEVRGKEVGRWSQNAGRVSVWMRKPINEGELEWTGTTDLPKDQQPVNTIAFEAVVPRVLDARLGTDIVRIRPVENWKIHAEKDRGWTQITRKDDAVAFQTTSQSAAPVKVVITPAAPPAPNGTTGQSAPLPQARTAQTTVQIPEIKAVNAEPQPTVEKTEAPLSWTMPLTFLFVWCIAFAILGLLLVRYPQSTWPEQLGLIAGLFGAAVLGYWWLGVGGWAVARSAWLNQSVRRSSVQ